MNKAKLFAYSFLISSFSILALAYHGRPTETRHTGPSLTQIDHGVFVTSQLTPMDLPTLHRQGVKTIIDHRPDMEAAGQPSSAEMQLAAMRTGLDFHFIPIPHEGIPDESVEQLQKVLAQEQKPVVLYCRSGRRAVRTFALAQASRVDGPGANTILAMVSSAGFSADDLKEDIVTRIANRSASQITRK